MDSKKLANNILEFLFDSTAIPADKRLYFRPEERLINQSYENAKADSFKAYGKENKNSDFYPIRNRQLTQREASIMDRKNIIASMDVLSQNFEENDPISESLRAMAFTVSKMAEEEFESRTAKKKMEFVTCPKCGNKKVLKQMGYCIKCGKKGIGKDKKEDKDDKKKDKKASEDFWTKAASEAVALALVEDVCGTSEETKEEEQDVDAKKKDDACMKDEEASKKEDDDDDASASMKKDDDDDDEATAKKKEDEEEVEAKKKDDDDDDDATAAKKDEDDDATAAKKVDEKELPPEKEAKKVDKEVCPEPEKEAKKIDKDDKGVCPEPEKAAGSEEKPKGDLKKEEVESKKKIVNTDMLANVEGIEMNVGMLSLDDIGELTATEKEDMDKLFQ